MAIGLTDQLEKQLEKQLKLEERDKKGVNIFVSGKAGSGKSTLINCVLQLVKKGSKAPEHHSLPSKQTEEMQYRVYRYRNYINDVEVTMFDTSGKCWSWEHKNNVDLCLFCVDMSKLRFDSLEYTEVMKNVGTTLGVDMWRHTIFVLTFANRYISQIEERYQSNPEGKKQKFLAQVELWKNKLCSTLHMKASVNPKVTRNIQVVPVGNNYHSQLFSDECKWINRLWESAVSAVKPDARSAVEKIIGHDLHDESKRMPLHVAAVQTRQHSRQLDQVQLPHDIMADNELEISDSGEGYISEPPINENVRT